MRILLPMSGTHEVVNVLAVPPVVFGAIAFAVLMFLLLVTYAFKSIRTRH